MINYFKRYSGVAALKMISTFTTAGTGILLARSLSLTDRGNVATLSSILGILVVLISSPRGEQILRSANSVKILFSKDELIIALTGLFFLGFSLTKLVANRGKYSILLIFFLSAIFIMYSSLNSLLQAIYFRKGQTLGNQKLMTLHVLIFFSLLIVTFLAFKPNLLNWLSTFLITEVLLCFIIAKLLKNNKTSFKIFSFLRDKKSEVETKQSITEKFAVYQAAFFLPVILLIASTFVTPANLAHFAVGMSLVSLISLPINPFYPSILSSSDHYLYRIRNAKVPLIFITLCSIGTYLILLNYLLKLMIPLFYGQKYNNLVQVLPEILLAGFSITMVILIMTILRGLHKFLRSSITGLTASTIFSILMYFQKDFGLNRWFLNLSISASTAMICGIYFLLCYEDN